MKNKNKYFLCILPAILLLIILFSFAKDTDDPRIQKIITQFAAFHSKYIQQKVYLHTDKDSYLAGENIWFKAYLVCDSTFLPDLVSKDIYVDFIGPSNSVIRTIILKTHGVSNAEIPLSDTIVEGNYQLRAYTNWMRNFDSGLFFKKTVSVKNMKYSGIITKGRLKNIDKANKKLDKALQKTKIQFFPEGGYLIAGIPCKVAFKAENENYQGLNVIGEVYDHKGTLITEFKSVHNGMGSFVFTPQSNNKYFAKVHYTEKKTDKVDLPNAIDKGIAMTVNPFEGNEIKIQINSNRPVSANIASNEVIMVIHSHGKIQVIEKAEMHGASVELKINKNKLPPGIAQITLFDNRMEPVCERLVFISEKEVNPFKIGIDRQLNADSLSYKINMEDSEHHPLNGSFSLAISKAFSDTIGLPKENILTSMLLTSDLKGYIENPAYYFDPLQANRQEMLDLVMLTNGWRRFVWKEIMANHFPAINYSLQGGISIGGRIIRDHFNLSIPNSKVKLHILNTYNDNFETTTDDYGRFIFKNLDYTDTIYAKLEAFKPSGGKAGQIILEDTAVPNIDYRIPREFIHAKFDKSRMRQNDKKMRLAAIKKYKPDSIPDTEGRKIHGTADNVIMVGQDASAYSNILEYMQGRVPGVNIYGNRVIIRGVSTILGSTDPLFLIDGLEINPTSVQAINPQDISVIEVIKGPSAAIYGMRGANGVIAFYSKRGYFVNRGVLEFGMLGYYKAREFYESDYPQNVYAQNNILKTIYWQPNIKLHPSGVFQINFKKEQDKTKTIVTLEGITDKGKPVYFRKVFD